MKKLLFTALIAISISTGAFAQNLNQIDPKAVNNFDVAFAGASNVEWSATADFTKATFFQNEQKVDVFYNPEGDLIATTRQIKVDELPTFVKRSFSKKYSDYVVKEAFKFQSNEETDYFISIENEKENLVLKVMPGSISTYSKTSKM